MPIALNSSDKSIHVGISPDSLGLEAGDGVYRLIFRSGHDTVRVDLSRTLLHLLGMQCLARLPDIAPDRPIEPMEAAYRDSARFVKDLSDRSIQLFLRQCESEPLICFLWYMRDADLLRRFCSNMSRRAASALLDDLEEGWRGRNPDTCEEPLTRQGRVAVMEVLGILHRMVREGLIPTGEIPPAFGGNAGNLQGVSGND
jgi:hypothetical protein